MPDTGRDEDPGLHIKGGSRGLTVEYQELQAAGGELESAVERLRELHVQGVDTCFRLYGLSAAPAAASTAAVALNAAVQALRRTIEDLADAADGLRKAVRNYLDTDGRVESLIKNLPGASQFAAVMLWGQQGGGYPSRMVSELGVPRGNDTVISLLAALAAGMVGSLRPVNVRKVEGDHGKVAVSGTARGLLERSNTMLSQDPGVIEILTVDRGGEQVRIVTLPGMQVSESPMVGPNPFDAYGNAEGRAEDSRYVAAAVAEALRQAGASAEDAVILVGYSQGGIHAVNTGARLAEDGEFSVEMIVTAGAPTGDRDVPDGVKVLHFEHRGDWVAGADGSSNPDTPDRITVTGSAPQPLLPDIAAGMGPAHQIGAYLDMASDADASTDPSLRESLGHLSGLIGPGALAGRSLFQFTRGQPPPKPAGPLRQLPCPAPVLVKPIAPLPGAQDCAVPKDWWPLPPGSR